MLKYDVTNKNVNNNVIFLLHSKYKNYSFYSALEKPICIKFVCE